MYYLEIKLEKKEEKIPNSNDFIAEVIHSQKSLGEDIYLDYFETDKLLELGFVYNKSTKGFSLEKDFTLLELKEITLAVNQLKYHKLIHGFIEHIIYNGELYFWDKALIYEGIDTFEYCLKYHNLLVLDDLKFLTKSDTMSEELLPFTSYTKRYISPNLEFITQNCLWDRKEGNKILKSFIPNINDYLLTSEVKNPVIL